MEQVADRYPLQHSITVRTARPPPPCWRWSRLVTFLILHMKRVNEAQQQLLKAITSFASAFPRGIACPAAQSSFDTPECYVVQGNKEWLAKA